MLIAICWVGMIASLLLVINLWPRGMLLICFVCFLSFVSAAQDFSGYQSDGMLLEAGFLSLFFAPPGLLAGPGTRASAFARQLLSAAVGVVPHLLRVRPGEAGQRRSAVAQLHRDGRVLPERSAAHLDRLVRAASAALVPRLATGATLVLELGLVLMLFLPRRWRIVCFFIVTAWQIPVILTANYTFLNYLVLVLGFLLLDDRFLLRVMPQRWKRFISPQPVAAAARKIWTR